MTAPAGEVVVASAAVEDIVAAEASDDIVAASAADHIPPAGSDQDVGAVGSPDGAPTARFAAVTEAELDLRAGRHKSDHMHGCLDCLQTGKVG